MAEAPKPAAKANPMRDLAIFVVVMVIVYISAHIVTVNFSTVLSGEFFYSDVAVCSRRSGKYTRSIGDFYLVKEFFYGSRCPLFCGNRVTHSSFGRGPS